MRAAAPWRLAALAAIAAAGVASILATGGGSVRFGAVASGGRVLPAYDYSISSLSGVATSLSASVPLPGGGAAAISIDLGTGLTGSVDTAVDKSGNIALLQRQIAAGSSLRIDSDAGQQPLLGSFRVDVASDLQFSAHDPPSAGGLDIVAGADTVHAAIGDSGVDLGLNGAAPVSFTWDGVRALWADTTAPDWQRRASLGLALLDLVYVQAAGAVDALNAIDAGTANDYPLRSDCDAFNQMPPFGVLVQGSSTLTWLGSGSVRSGDDFHWNFVDCWRKEAVASRLLNGGVDLRGYTRIVDDNHDYTRLGFEPSGAGDGGMIFDGLTVDRVHKDGLGRFIVDPEQRFTLSGGFAVVFSAQ